MPNYDFPPHLEALLQEHLESGDYTSTDEVLIAALRSLQFEKEDWAAVSEALDTFDAGNQGFSLDEAVAEVRRRNNVPS
jgi:Arc/MetJ-type ribon-helix-helix transcriptional regulator